MTAAMKSNFPYAALMVCALLVPSSMMLTSCREKSGVIPPGVVIEGIDGDPAAGLEESVPVYYQGELNSGAYDSLGTVYSSAASSSCRPAHIGGSPARAIAMAALRRQVLDLGGNGIMNLDCSVSGSTSYDMSDQDYRDYQEWRDCVYQYGDEEMRWSGHMPIGDECERLRTLPHSWRYEPPRCEQTASCSATAIRRNAPEH